MDFCKTRQFKIERWHKGLKISGSAEQDKEVMQHYENDSISGSIVSLDTVSKFYINISGTLELLSQLSSSRRYHRFAQLNF